MRFGDYRDSSGVSFFQNNILGSKAKILLFSGESRPRLARAAQGPGLPSGVRGHPGVSPGAPEAESFEGIDVTAPWESRRFFPGPDTSLHKYLPHQENKSYSFHSGKEASNAKPERRLAYLNYPQGFND